MILVDRYIPFLIDNDITEKQFMLLYLTYFKRVDLLHIYKEKVLKGEQTQKEEMFSLYKKGFLAYNDRNQYVLAPKFMNLFIDKFIATDEIYALYPAFVNSMGVDIPLTAMDRNIFGNIYISAIQGNAEEHREVIKDIEFAVKEKLLTFGIEKFVTSRYWIKIRERRLANTIKINTNTAFDNDF